MRHKKTSRIGNAIAWLAVSVAGGAAAVIATAVLTLLMSLATCLAVNPEAAMAAEWAAPVVGLIWAGALVRRAGRAASTGVGIIVGLAWALTWLYLIGRFDPHIWWTDALPEITWRHVSAWLAAPVLSTLGGMLGARMGRTRPLGKASLHIAAPVTVLIAMFASLPFVDSPGTYSLADGASLRVFAPDREGTTVRLFSFDFAANPKLRLGVYDRDADDSQPFDDSSTNYLGTPALAVFDRLGPEALCVVNAGFFGWADTRRVGFHVAPMVLDGRARYNVFRGTDLWTFGWKKTEGILDIRLLRQVPFNMLETQFDEAISHVRPLVVDGKAPRLEPGAGVTRLRCSRTSVGWSPESMRFHILIVRDPDGERASINAWKNDKNRQLGGWDLPQLQRFWMKKGVRYAIAFDGGDSTQLVYRSSRGTNAVGSARLSITLGYLGDRPIRFWIPVLPTRHSDLGVMNYLYVVNGGSR